MLKLVQYWLFVCLLMLSSQAVALAVDLTGMRAIGNCAGMTKTADGVVIDCDDHSQVRLQVLAPDLVRVRAAFQTSLPQHDHSWAIARTDWNKDKVPFTVSNSESKDDFSLETSELRVVVIRKPLRVLFYDAHSGRLINADGLPMQYNPTSGAVAAAKTIGSEEHLYGLGEKAAHLDKRHGAYEMWSSDTPGYLIGRDPIYQSIPFYIGLLMDPADTSVSDPSRSWRGCAYGIFFDNSYRTHFDLSSSDPEHVIFQSDGGEMNYYFFYGPSIKKILNRYTELTGRMPLPPKWALGNQQSRYSYANEQQVRDVVTRYKKENIPLDVLHFDIHYMDAYRVFTWNHERFPDPKGLIKWLNDQGVKVVTIIDPGVKYEPGGSYSVFNEGTVHNYFLKKTNGEPYVGEVWPGKSVFVDYTIADAAKWWGDQHKALLDTGVSGIWNDMNEPADFQSRDGDKWKDVVNYDEGEHSKHAKMRNLFAFLECKATYEGLQRLHPDERPYVITRSGYAGIQRYATMWTGDSNASWDALALSIPMFETLGLSGESFVGADLGGYMGRSDGEFLTRSYQIGFLTPFCRNHHAVDYYDQEPWRFGKRYEDIIRKFVQLRYHLLPYLYTVLAQAHETGTPWFRPLILEDQDDYNALDIDDEFMVGSALLAAPVLHPGVTKRDLYLPRGQWYDYFTGEKYEGGQYISVQAPLDTVPLFVKAGSILPTGPAVDFVGQAGGDAIKYDVYPDKDGAAVGHLYQDDGITPAYLNGACEHFTLKFKDGKATSASSRDNAEKPLPSTAINLRRQ